MPDPNDVVPGTIYVIRYYFKDHNTEESGDLCFSHTLNDAKLDLEMEAQKMMAKYQTMLWPSSTQRYATKGEDFKLELVIEAIPD